MKTNPTLIRIAVTTALLALGAGATAIAQQARGEHGWSKGEPMDVAAMEQRIAERAAAMASGVTRGDALMTRDTVDRETPATTATSSKVGALECWVSWLMMIVASSYEGHYAVPARCAAMRSRKASPLRLIVRSCVL